MGLVTDHDAVIERLQSLDRPLSVDESLQYWVALWQKAANGILRLQAENAQLRAKLAAAESELRCATALRDGASDRGRA